MIHLLFKDILLQKKMLIVGFAYIASLILLFQQRGGPMLTASIVAVAYIMIQTSCAYDDKSKSDVLYNSLAISRKKIVFAKYISIFMYGAIALIFYTIFYVFIKTTGININIDKVTITAILSALVSLVIINGLYLPIYYKMGYAKSKTLNILLFVGIFVLGSSAYRSNLDSLLLQAFLGRMNSISETTLVFSVVVVSVVGYLLSYLLALKFYKNREF